MASETRQMTNSHFVSVSGDVWWPRVRLREVQEVGRSFRIPGHLPQPEFILCRRKHHYCRSQCCLLGLDSRGKVSFIAFKLKVLEIFRVIFPLINQFLKALKIRHFSFKRLSYAMVTHFIKSLLMRLYVL